MPAWAIATFLTLSLMPRVDRVQVKGKAGAALKQAVEDARSRLRQPACLAVLGDFDVALEEPLNASGVAADQWLDRIVFADGVGQAACRRSDVLFATAAGSRVVFACAQRFALLVARDPDLGAALVIHEMLHTLGLPEGPPTSGEITARVRKRCGP
jgi:hypothetical protein